MNYREAVKQGRKLVSELSTRQWKLGDLALELAPMGEDRSNNGTQELLAKFAHDIEADEGTLNEYRRCAAAWPHRDRSSEHSWTVHYRLRSLPDRSQVIRSRGAWTTRQAQVAAGHKPSASLPVRHGDKVETVRKLLADPEVAADVMRDDKTRRQASKATDTIARELVREAKQRDREDYPQETADRDVLTIVSFINDADERVKAAIRVLRSGFIVTEEWRTAIIDAVERLETSAEWLRTVAESEHPTTDSALDALLRGR